MNVPSENMVTSSWSLGTTAPKMTGSGRRQDSGPRMSPHALVQEYINLTEHLYAVVTNGRQLRLLRDSSRLIKLSYLEFDLERIFVEGLFADFRVLFRLLHASRMPVTRAAASESIIERYHQDALEQGARIREGLSSAVEEVIVLLSNGFLEHPENDAFRQSVVEGELMAKDYYREVLRLIYRLLFLMVAEDRTLIYPANANPKHRKLYLQYYSVQRLRRLAQLPWLSDAERHHDLWQGLMATFRLFRSGCGGEKLGIAPLDGQLFRADSLETIESLHIDNRTLCDALRKLSVFRNPTTGQWMRINYASLNTEEFGSVYEGLLECVPTFLTNPFRFHLRHAAGNQRKTSGSYYTPDVLVEQLKRSALMPVLQAKLEKAREGASGKWPVASGEKNFTREWKEIINGILSGLGSLEKRNELSGSRLQIVKALSEIGVVWNDQPDKAGGSIDPGQHSGGVGQAQSKGISTLLEHRQRKPERTGDSLATEPQGRPYRGTADPIRIGGNNHPEQTTSRSSAITLTPDQLGKLWDKLPLTTRHSLLAEQALLSVRVCDPACGSGHFLLSAAHRIARELALVRSGGDEPSPDAQRHALRDVITRCLFGVDVNEMAVELCKVTLWIESAEPGKPLGFLDHHIKVGNSLLGANPARIREGIPDAAYKPLTGDNKKAVTWMKKLNKEHRGKAHVRAQQALDFGEQAPWERLGNLPSAMARLETTPDDSVEEVAAKEQHYAELVESTGYLHARLLCDAWCCAFVWPKEREEWGAELHTGHLRKIEKSPYEIDHRLREAIPQLAQDYAFFHWHLEFPTVFREPGQGEEPDNQLTGLCGGFDCILGNPPWEHMELKESEWFAELAPEIAKAAGAKRKKLIEDLPQTDPALHSRYYQEIRLINGTRHILSNSGNFPFCGRGRVNLYTVFAEQFRNLLGPTGRAGCVLPTGIATDDTTKFFFQDVVERKSLVSLYDFENRKAIFRGVHRSFKFCLFTVGSGIAPAADEAAFAFFCLEVADLEDEERRFTLKPEDIALLNPNTGNCPIFRGKRDAELTKHIYRHVPVLWREARDGQPEHNPWQLSFKQGLFNMTSDSHHFRTAAELREDGYTLQGNRFTKKDVPVDREPAEPAELKVAEEEAAYSSQHASFINHNSETYLPLYEAKMIHHFDHRWATYEEKPDGKVEAREVTPVEKSDPNFVVQPRYWVREDVVESALPHYPEKLWTALQEEDYHAIHHEMFLWAIGACIELNDAPRIEHLTKRARQAGVELPLVNLETGDPIHDDALRLQQQYPLETPDLEAFQQAVDDETLPRLARQWVQRFSPKWLMGWRDITNTTNERTTIASVVPRVGVGHTAPLFLSPLWRGRNALQFISNLVSFPADFTARQKVGGTHLTYGLLKQLPYLPPDSLHTSTFINHPFLTSRALELLYTTHDLAPLARDFFSPSNHSQLTPDHSPLPPPFPYDEERRFQIRCELDAAFFHLYLPSEANGGWRVASRENGDVADETPEELATLKHCFATPHDAVGYIMDTFPIVKRKDEKAHNGQYRTKDRILEIYDAMQQALATDRDWQSPLNPPPGEREIRSGKKWSYPAEIRSLPSGQRIVMVSEDYLMEVIPAILLEAGNRRLKWSDFTDALRYLARPQKLEEAAVGEDATLVRNWSQAASQPFALSEIIPVIEQMGGNNFAIDTEGKEHVIHLKTPNPPAADQWAAYDAWLVMRVVSASNVVVPLDMEEQDLFNSVEHLREHLA